MFLPIGDHPNPRGYTPWVTWLLIAANVLIYLFVSAPLSVQAVDPADPALGAWLAVLREALGGTLPPLDALSAYDVFVFEHGYKPGAPTAPDLFASLFLHAGPGHLAGNMLFLWIYGDNVEHRLGHLGHLATYLLTGVAATLSFGLLAGDSMTPLVGASGAISGVLGFYFLFFPRNQVRVFVLLFPFVMQTVFISARVVLGAYVVFSNLLPLLIGAGGNVAYGAHLGGFFAGLALAWGVERRGQGLAGSGAPPPGLAEIDDGLELAGSLIAQRRLNEANRLLMGLIAGHPDRPQRARARLLMGLLRLEAGQPQAAWHHLVEAAELAPGTEVERQARHAMARVLSLSRGAPP